MRLIVAALLLCVSCASASGVTAASSPTPDAQSLPTLNPAAMPSPRTTETPQPSPTTTARDAVLDVADLPSGFAMTSERDDRWDVFSWDGYVHGWLRFYTRSASAGFGDAMTEFTAWATAADAKAEIANALKYTTEMQGWGKEIPLTATIGDEAHAVEYYATAVQGRAAYAIWFRVANTTNLVWIAGPPGTIELQAAIDLAKKQLARLRA
jgi:hypothetical protein